MTLNQKQNGGSWVLLGSYNFTPGAGQKVTLAASADGTTIADAMLFVGSGAQPANLLYVHADHLGSPQKLTDASQATGWDGVFDPFGEEVALTGLAAMPMRFPGQYGDDETGYSDNWFRDYDPSLGRYLQSDPIGLVGGINAYAYVISNPTRFVDRLGLDWEYSQSTGEMRYVDDETGQSRHIDDGYSGNGAGLNNPAMQDQAGVGPIPQGDYTIEQQRDSPNTGPHVMDLTPDPNNNMYGRDAFQIHGDTSCQCQSASNGCIVLPRRTRDYINNSSDRHLRVVP